MNTISSTSNTINLYNQEKIQAAKVLEQIEKEKQKESDSVNISQQAFQTLGISTQTESNSIPLDSLVAAGTITQEQANAVLSVFQSLGKTIQTSGTYNNKTKPENPLDNLVSAGTITQAQEDSIKSALEEAMKANRPRGKSDMVDTLDSLVSAGTITQAQEDSIENIFESSLG